MKRIPLVVMVVVGFIAGLMTVSPVGAQSARQAGANAARSAVSAQPALAPITVAGVKIPPFLLKNKYAYRLIFPLADRAPTQATMDESGVVRMGNILHEGKLWSATIDPRMIVCAEAINLPILPGAFHFAACFSFGEAGLILESEDGSTTTLIHDLIMGTGPEKAFSIDGTIGFQLLQMRASSLEAFQGTKPLDPKIRNRLDPRRVDVQLFFLAEVEEAARLAALTAIQALKAERPEAADRSALVQKYFVLGANCVSSGIQNLSRAVLPACRPEFLKLGKRDISEIPDWNPAIARTWISSWNDISLVSFAGLQGETIDDKKLLAVADFQKNLRSHNQVSLPWRAKVLIDWAAGRR